MYKAISAVAAVIVASALLIPTASIAAPEAASSDDGVVSTTVFYADLNLARPRDVRTLEGRIGYAARGVCGTPFAFEILENPERHQCIIAAAASAQPALEALVAAAHRGVVTVGYGAALIVTAPRQ
jgi:UrcA family protein